MKLSIPSGTTSKRVDIFVQDSSSTVGDGLAGLTNATSGLTCYSHIDTDGNAGATAQTLASATLGTFTSNGFKEKDATNMPGVYEYGIPNALLAAGVKWAVLYFKGAANMAPVVLEIEVTATSNQDGVHGGLTALPNAAANAAGGLPISAAGALDLDEMNADIEIIQTSAADIQTRIPAALTSNGNIKSSFLEVISTVLTEGATGRLAAAIIKFFNIATPAATMDHGVLVDTVTTVTSSPTVGDVADAVMEEVMSGHVTAGTFGNYIRRLMLASNLIVMAAGSDATHLVFSTIDGGTPSAVDDFYKGRVVIFTSGALANQAVSISAYVGATKTATISAATGSAAAAVTAMLL